MAIDKTGTSPYIRSAPLQTGGFFGIGKSEKIATLEDAQKLAAENDGSEAIIKHETNDGTFYTVHSVDSDEIRDFNDTNLEPNLLCFSVDKKGSKKPEVVVDATQMAGQNLQEDVKELEGLQVSDLSKMAPKKIDSIPRLNRALSQLGFERLDQFQAKKSLDDLFAAPIPLPEPDNAFGPKPLGREHYNKLAKQFGFKDFADFELKTKLLTPAAKNDLHCGMEQTIKNSPKMPAAVFNQFLQKEMQTQLQVAMTLEVLPNVASTNGTTTQDQFQAAFDGALGKSLPGQTMTPVLRNQISEKLGFRDFSAFKAALSVLSEPQRLSMLAILSDNSKISTNKSGILDCSQASHDIAAFLSKEINAMLNPEVDTAGMGLKVDRPPLGPMKFDPPCEQWSAGGMMAVFDAFQKLKTNSPDQLGTAAALTYKYDPNPPQASKLPSENPAKNNMIDILTSSMFIAHTETGENTVVIHDGAVTGSEKAVMEKQAKVFAEKLEIFQRDFNTPERMYSDKELGERNLLTANGTFNSTEAIDLFKTLTVQDPAATNKKLSPEQQTAFNQVYALVRAMGKYNVDIDKFFPSLKGVFDTDATTGKIVSNNKSVSALYDLFFKNPGQNKETIAAIQKDLAKVLVTPPPKEFSNRMLSDAVFLAEQLNEGRHLQQFLNNINPTGSTDVLVDGVQGVKTKAAIERLQFTVMAKIIESKLPIPMSTQTQAEMKKVYTALAKNPPDTANLQQSLQNLLKSELAGEENQILKANLINSLQDLKKGTFSQKTAQDLITSWLQLVDSNREGNIGGDLILHEIGHNIMSNALEPNEFKSIKEDWDAIGGFDVSRTDKEYDMEAALEETTKSFFTKGPEEVSDYGQTSGYEDFAETFRMFNANPKELLAMAPTKFMMMNAVINKDPAVAQKHLNALLDELVKDKRITDKNAFIKPSLDKIMGYDPNAKGFVSSGMLDKLTATYGDQFKLYTPPVTTKSSQSTSFLSALGDAVTASFVKTFKTADAIAAHIRHKPGNENLSNVEAINKSGLTPSQFMSIDTAVTKLLQSIPAPVGTHYDEGKLKELLGAKLYDSLPDSFKVMLSNQNSSPLVKFLTEPSGAKPSPLMLTAQMINECIDREALLPGLTKSKLSEKVGTMKSSLGVGFEGQGPGKLIEELKHPQDSSAKPSPSLQKVIDNINKILGDYNQTHMPSIPLVSIDSKALLAFLEDVELNRQLTTSPKPTVTDIFISTFGIVPTK